MVAVATQAVTSTTELYDSAVAFIERIKRVIDMLRGRTKGQGGVTNEEKRLVEALRQPIAQDNARQVTLQIVGNNNSVIVINRAVNFDIIDFLHGTTSRFEASPASQKEAHLQNGELARDHAGALIAALEREAAFTQDLIRRGVPQDAQLMERLCRRIRLAGVNAIGTDSPLGRPWENLMDEALDLAGLSAILRSLVGTIRRRWLS